MAISCRHLYIFNTWPGFYKQTKRKIQSQEVIILRTIIGFCNDACIYDQSTMSRIRETCCVTSFIAPSQNNDLDRKPFFFFFKKLDDTLMSSTVLPGAEGRGVQHHSLGFLIFSIPADLCSYLWS